jgi:hypothetical protein
MARRDGTPLWLPADGATGVALDRAELRGGSDGSYSEAWLQQMLDAHPEVFPIGQIEPGLGTLRPVCVELPLDIRGRSGALDNLLMTESGGLVLVETKLWRNPEARRTVVAQAKEYAAAVFGLDYEGLELAVRRARRTRGKPDIPLFEIVTGSSPVDPDEPGFIDAVSRNLRQGRAVVAVVGDGIREDITVLRDLLQSHAGHRFVFALVELGVFEAPAPGARLILPSVLAQTTLIERGVVHIEERAHPPLAGRIVVAPAVSQPPKAPTRRAVGLSEDEFLELVDQNHPGSAQLLRQFLDEAVGHGIYPDVQRGMSLKYDAGEEGTLNVAVINKDLELETWAASYTPPGATHRGKAGRRYVERLAELIGGEAPFVQDGHKLKKGGHLPKVTDLLPMHSTEWLAAIDEYVAALLPRRD